MMTLKHFLDRPLWAAAAGYDFNYMDCMSYTANAYDHSFSLLLNSLRILPQTEVESFIYGYCALSRLELVLLYGLLFSGWWLL